MIVILSAEAEQDLETIGQYIANDSPRRAVSFIDELLSRCLAIANAPFAHSLIPRHEHTGIRRCFHGNYVICYRVDASMIGIVHILHGAMDYEAALFRDD
jgi:toxin ParE1/3/4